MSAKSETLEPLTSFCFTYCIHVRMIYPSVSVIYNKKCDCQVDALSPRRLIALYGTYSCGWSSRG